MSAPVTERPQAPVSGPQPPRSSHRVLSAVAVVVLLIFGFNQLQGMLPSLHNPFKSKTTDLSQPVMLQRLTEIHTYDAEHANFQVIVDLKKKPDYIPAALIGSEKLFVAGGSAEAGVDFSNLGSGDVVVGPNHSITITLPHAKLGETTVDPDQSHLASDHEGALTRIGSLFGSNGSDNELYKLAKAKIATQAAADPTIITSAETNTRTMLVALMAAAGFKTTTVNFGGPTGRG